MRALLIRWVLVSGLLVPAYGCEGPAGPTVPLNEAFTLAPGETATIRDNSLSVRFNGVSGDSRCPANAICIQGGDAAIGIRVSGLMAAPSDLELHTGDMKPVVYQGLTIALVALVPYPFSTTAIPQDEYRATLRVTD